MPAPSENPSAAGDLRSASVPPPPPSRTRSGWENPAAVGVVPGAVYMDRATDTRRDVHVWCSPALSPAANAARGHGRRKLLLLIVLGRRALRYVPAAVRDGDHRGCSTPVVSGRDGAAAAVG